jgi:putative methionine-R-sulfoxide reductase with GAF domain
VTEQENKPVLDEQTFDKLLEAAYVLQQHNRKVRELEERMESHIERLREQESANEAPLPRSRSESDESPRSDGDYTLTLAEIVEAQRQIQARHLELDKALAVVAERVARITSATGAAIGILDEKMVRYRAGAGAPALPVGSEVPLTTAICAASVRTGQVIRSEDVNTELLFDPEPCRQRGILSLVAVPVYQDGSIVGALELYFDRVHGYAEQDIHTCQLMAGLVTEALGRDAQLAIKKSMAAERSTMLAAIESLQPNLVAWAEDDSPADVEPQMDASALTAAKSSCWKCGGHLALEEQFCGKCGAPRASHGGISDMQGDELPAPFSLPELQESGLVSARSFSARADEDVIEDSLSSESQPGEDSVETPSTALVKPQQDLVWSSAAKARDFLESLAATHAPGALARFWRSRRGDFYLAIAVVLVMVVIRWGIWSDHSVGATGRGSPVSGSASRVRQPSPDADLSAFDKLLISLGLAEAPEVPEYKGNPDTQVWVDLHTALYYCPGSDLYGKTAKGKLTSQRDAQLDQFEPADRKACD